MGTQNYPSPGALMIKFLDNVKPHRIYSMGGLNPSLINVNGEKMFVYIKNLSPAQLSNDNPDIWRIQLPKRSEFLEIKNSNYLFVLLGYDYIRNVYTTWNPFWCKQRLNIAESCSMYSRLSLQERVSLKQRTEKMPLQNEGDVVCIPPALLANYLFNIRKYYPEESIYVPVGSSIQKRKKEEIQQNNKKNTPQYTLDQFGKLEALDPYIIELLLPQVKGVDYPDYESIIKQVKEYYPTEATEKMNPVDWMTLFDNTKWHRKRGRKSLSVHSSKSSQQVESTALKVLSEDLIKIEESYDEISEIQDDSESNNIPDKQQKSVDITKLKSVFDKKVTSYKYFWFVAIVSLVKEYKQELSYDDILIRMAALSWPIVLGDGIDLGEQDFLVKYLTSLQRKTNIIKNASSNAVEFQLHLYNVKDTLAPLLNNVPYRFLSPWIKFTTKEEVIKKSNDKDFDGLYAINTEGIKINGEWWRYIDTHYIELYDFSLQSFIKFAKQYNNSLKLLRLMKNGWGM